MNDVLGVKVDRINMDMVLDRVETWINGERKHYIVTTNLEFIKDAQADQDFKQILNKADLSIPDSSRIGWLMALSSQKSLITKLMLLPLGLFPQLFQFDIVTGIDLTERLCEESSKKGFTVAFLGGGMGVAEKSAQCLQKKHQNLKVLFSDSGPMIDNEGNVTLRNETTKQSAQWERLPRPFGARNDEGIDILFVAFGHPKQEKWIAQNLKRYSVKVMIGVGGAFDFISGNVIRAPKLIRRLNLEWAFRLILEPWRIKRQLLLVGFILRIVFRG